MQPLTTAPRTGYTDAQVTALLVATDLEVDFGVELLDQDLTLVEDISADCSGWIVKRDNLANVHGTLENLTISRALAWGYDRVRPFQLLSSPSAGLDGVRWNEGVYLMTTPDTALGETPQSWVVSGFDQLYLLQDCIGDSYSVAAGANVLAAVRAVFVAAGIVSPVLLDSSGSAKTLATAMVWVQDSSNAPTWIKVANELLAAIGYRGLWCDQDGAFRSGPYVQPENRPSEWTFAVGDLKVGMVAEDRKVTNDVWGVPNWMRFVRNQDTPPTEGAGRYTKTNPSTGPASIASVGIRRAPPVYLDAVSQADLIVQGDRLFAAATRVTEVITTKVSPFPAAWHSDRVTYTDDALGLPRQAQCRSWSLPSDGSDGDYVLETVS
jgi:hypothetical protein